MTRLVVYLTKRKHNDTITITTIIKGDNYNMSGTRKVLLRNTGHYAIVDYEDYEMVERFSPWYENDQGYAVKKTRVKGKNVSIRMHSLINGTPKGLVTDHINGNRLDNRKENLRSVGQMINCWNTENIGRKHTVYDLPKGISYDKTKQKYVGTKTVRRRFDTLEEALEFVNKSERSIYGRHTTGGSQGCGNK